MRPPIPQNHTGPSDGEAVFRIGIDLGGTKIAGLVLTANNEAVAESRRPTPQGDYDATCQAIRDFVADLRQRAGLSQQKSTIGIGIPGSISTRTRKIQNANSVVLNGRDLHGDLEELFGEPIRLANDANCFALSEAIDGAGAGSSIVFGVIAGTGLGGSIVIDGQLISGPRATAGEWGHNPLPWIKADEFPGPTCWCGRSGCLETWVSGPGLSADHARITGCDKTAIEIEQAAHAGDATARASLTRHADRFARGLAHVVNIIDPDVVVLGGGLSQMAHLYRELPELMAPHLFADTTDIRIESPRWGDASGVRGAAWLWA